MTLIIPDDILQATRLNENDFRIEIACLLFDKQRLNLGLAARFARLSRGAFEDELLDRSIPIYRYEAKDFEADLETMRRRPLEK